ncbi:olfactory receptor 2D2-like [Spea bombifrons]|uniref:olfactory receptor 2D2-like n=1 Tax=Spea bombifrons TaxID=233779 RepID=UPI00234B6712|nr:olfactory receptor 2D2-like [Spea bombifrons]
MENASQSSVTEFILLGLSYDPRARCVLFHLFLVVYVVTLAENILLIIAVRIDSRLHSPMYFFLTNLSFMDICYTSVIVPKMLVDFISMKNTISFTGCMVQIFCYFFIGESECIALAFMAYDRYVAICNPLRYNMTMSNRACVRMIIFAWMCGYSISLVDLLFIYRLTFCGANKVDHFFCESPSIIKLSCGDHFLVNTVKLVSSAIVLLLPFCYIIISYARIIVTIIKTRTGKYKSFSMCFAHLIVVVCFYGTSSLIYLQPEHSMGTGNKVMSVFYAVGTPLMNPFIYSLRNKDVHRALRKLKYQMSSLEKRQN